MANETILVVEDNEMNLKLVRSLLQLGKYEVLDAGDAEKGIQLARDRRPQLILMDIQLPGMDGLSATRLLKEDPELKAIPILALTSYAMQGDEQKALAAGCAGYITKPIDTRNFLKIVQQFTHPSEGGRGDQKAEPSSLKAKILIVDDEPLNVKLLTAKIPRDKFDVVFAYSGEEALAKVDAVVPDLILLDVMMPGLNGYEITQQLKNDPKTRPIPIILVTALDGAEDRVRGLEAGAEEFLSKPVNKPELLARINSMLRLKQYQEQLSLRTQSETHFSGPSGAAESSRPGTGTQRVLLVEDNEKDVRLIQSYLDNQPYEIVVARSGTEALALVDYEKIDLMLLDILLPGVDGFEVCRRLRDAENTRDIQVVVVTFLSDLESKIKGVELGADDFLIKPIDRRELKARINVLLKKKSYLDQLHSHYQMALNSAMNDGLTLLYNQAYFKRFLELEVKRSNRQGYPTALVMIDLDDFKKYNDHLGHLAGDLILRELAQVIRDNVREIDLAARYGGEEFAVVLPYTDTIGALTVAERIRTAIAGHAYSLDTVSACGRLTASLGVAFCPMDATTTEALIDKADAMLFKAKNTGKNRVCAYVDPPPAAQAVHDVRPTA